MTTKDKTGDQLMASIRKTKTEAGISEQEPAATPKAPVATPKAAAAPRKKAAAKAKPAAAQRSRMTKKKVAAKPRATKTAAKAENAGYQSTRRVWPD